MICGHFFCLHQKLCHVRSYPIHLCSDESYFLLCFSGKGNKEQCWRRTHWRMPVLCLDWTLMQRQWNEMPSYQMSVGRRPSRLLWTRRGVSNKRRSQPSKRWHQKRRLLRRPLSKKTDKIEMPCKDMKLWILVKVVVLFVLLTKFYVQMII